MSAGQSTGFLNRVLGVRVHPDAPPSRKLMALDLHPDCKRRLIEVIAEGLPMIKVNNGMFLERMSLTMGLYKTEQVIPEKGRLRNQLVEYVSDFPALDFIGEILGTELDERHEYLADTPSIELTRLKGYGDPKAIAQSLVDQFDSLPWKYTLSIRLPAKINDFFNSLVKEFPLAEHIRLVTPEAGLDERFPLLSKDEKRHKRIHGRGGLLFAPKDPEWGENSAYLQIDVDGFVGTYGTTRPAIRAIDILRSICGLAIATRLLKVQYSFSPFPVKTHFYVHKHTDGGCEIDGKFDLEDHYASAFNDLELHDLDGQLKEEERQKKWAVARLQDMRTVFSAGERSEKVLLASQWLFDSYAGKDELLSFVQTMIVLEILLGEKDRSDEIGLGELLRNRCAYLIGKTHKQRPEILRDFNRIYAVRSLIVHRGKSRLTPDERSLFHNLRWMCRRVIQEELTLLKADTAPA